MDDIVTRLRNNFATKDYPMLKDHCHCCAIPKDWGGHHDNCLYDQAADEIERLGELLFQEIYRSQEKVDVIDDLRAELAEFQRQYLMLKKDRDRFEAIAEQAVKTLESAMAIIEQIQGAVHND